ncbi:DUF455 family protein [bacterium]|nr:DUF455 family protein [bacterium]
MRYERIRDHRQFKPGYSVDENATRFSNYYHVLRELVHLHNGWLPRVGPVDVKCLLGIHVHEDAVFVSEINRRLFVLRSSKDYPAAPGEEFTAILDHLAGLETWQEYIGCVYSVVKPRLIDAWETHCVETDPILDEPTIRVLSRFLHITAKHINGGVALVESIFHEEEFHERLSPAIRRTEELWSKLGTEPFARPLKSGATRELKPMPRLKLPARDSFIRISNEESPIHPPKNDEERIRYLHALMDAEISAAEFSALDSHENPTLPWEFHENMARETWDEIRHAQVMEAILKESDAAWGDCPVSLQSFPEIYAKDLPGRLILLNRQGEERARLCRKHCNEEKLLQVFDYVLGDEARHAANGVKWGIHLLGSREKFLERAEELTKSTHTAEAAKA